jgi:hypothetical protein
MEAQRQHCKVCGSTENIEPDERFCQKCIGAMSLVNRGNGLPDGARESSGHRWGNPVLIDSAPQRTDIRADAARALANLFDRWAKTARKAAMRIGAPR